MTSQNDSSAGYPDAERLELVEEIHGHPVAKLASIMLEPAQTGARAP